MSCLKTSLTTCLVVMVIWTSSALAEQRSLLHLQAMMQCSTGINNVYATFNGHGCYCGMGGAGQVVDDVDACCKQHDDCYGRLMQTQCSNLGQVYYQNYDYSCMNTGRGYNEPVCSQNNNFNLCSKLLCHCDAQFANCIRGRRPSNRQCPLDPLSKFVLGRK